MTTEFIDTTKPNAVNLILMMGTLLDITFAYVTVYLLISKLYAMIYIRYSMSNKNDIETENVDDFHIKTLHENKMILVVSKLVILLLIAVISSLIAIILILFFGDWVQLTYVTDQMINVLVLYFTFDFSKDIYIKYCCGKWCIVKCFPYIKTFSMTCQCDNKKNGCKQCCCYTCNNCYSKEKRTEQQHIFKLAKQEAELLVNEL